MAKYLVLAIVGLVLGNAMAGESWWRVFGEIRSDNSGGGYADEEIASVPRMKEFLAATTFDEWTNFEDDLVKLSYPKSDLLKLEVNDGKQDNLKQDGTRTGAENPIQRIYVLKAGNFIYGAFVVAKADWLDDGNGSCGPMVHHVYQIKDGCLVRFSLLPGGAIKRAQILGDKLRLMSFEGSHLLCRREIYEQMIESLSLKIKHPWSAAQLQDETGKRYSMLGRAGWLHPGVSLADANKIMGADANAVGGIYRWTGVWNDYPSELKAEFKDGVLVKLLNEGVARTGEEAVKGSFSWAEDRLERYTKSAHPVTENPDGTPVDPEPPPGPPPTAAQIADLTEVVAALAQKPTADEWRRCANLIVGLVEDHAVRDPRVMRAVLDHGVGSEGELSVLEKCGYGGVEKWIEQKLTAMLGEAPSKIEPSPIVEIVSRAYDATALLRRLVELNPAAAAGRVRALFETRERAWTLAAIHARICLTRNSRSNSSQRVCAVPLK